VGWCSPPNNVGVGVKRIPFHIAWDAGFRQVWLKCGWVSYTKLFLKGFNEKNKAQLTNAITVMIRNVDW
jgi:hypothetical protein